MTDKPLRTPLKTATGLGSARAGTDHFIKQRVSAIALIVLIPWFLYSLISAYELGYDGARAWLGSPVIAVVMAITVTAAIYHMRLGMQVVIEDYIAKHGSRVALLILNTFIAGLLWAGSLFAIFKVAFGG